MSITIGKKQFGLMKFLVPVGFFASIFAPVQLAYIPLYVWAGFAWLMWVLTGIRDNGKIQKEEMAKVREQIEAR